MNNPRDWSGALTLLALQVVGLLGAGALIAILLLILFR